jgi:hypothetical protein
MIFNIVNFYKNLTLAISAGYKCSTPSWAIGGAHLILTFWEFNSKKLESPLN